VVGSLPSESWLELICVQPDPFQTKIPLSDEEITFVPLCWSRQVFPIVELLTTSHPPEAKSRRTIVPPIVIANSPTRSVTSAAQLRPFGSDLSAGSQILSSAEMLLTYMPACVVTHSESPYSTMPVIQLFANGEGLTPSGSAPATMWPFHSASPPVVPIHTVSPTAVSAVIESEGRPSNRFRRSHDDPSGSSRLTPEPVVPTHSRRLRSRASTLSELFASPPGSRA
jgi:hypothetical protein